MYSRYSSYKNAWIANNPPGFAYIFFHNMKDAIRAVAATNGGMLCGNRVRVELTPIDEEEDNRYHMNVRGRRRGGGGYRRPRPPSRSPPPPGSPVPRYKRRPSPSPRRYSERSADTGRDSPVRSRSPVPRHVPYRPHYERKERYHKDFEFQQYTTESGSPRTGKSYTTGPIKEPYKDHHNHDDKYESLNSSLDRSPNLYRSRDVHYDNEHTHEIFPANEFQQTKSHSSGRSRRRSCDENYRGTESSTWNIDVEGNQYYYPGSPPSPPPLHSAEHQYAGRNNDHYPKYKSQSSDKSFPRNSRYDVQQDIVYTSTYPQSPSPPPPPPSPPIPRNEDRSSRRRPSRSREDRQKSWKGKESNSDHHHSHKVQRHRSQSPPSYYTRDHDEYVSSMVNNNSPNRELDEYHLKSRSTNKQYKKALPVSDRNKADHSPLVYEQIEEGTDGFFSEVGYHSPPRHPPKEYIQTVDGRDYTTKEDASSSHQQVYIEEGPYESTHNIQQESYEDQFLEIDEVKGNVEDDENGIYSRDVDHQLREREVIYSKEREVLRKKRHHQDREVLHRKHEREVIVKRSPVRNRFVCL